MGYSTKCCLSHTSKRGVRKINNGNENGEK